ncbi:hypothetical protein ANN_07489 [Periplaneta americana]|uniref:AN1-type domain-containing protein n=1 Tax=Periplaneta americana TaxID=6978 RepID=A0ABQ8T0C5_PERAM|nr:hypothetical protein ANN_07489 [Periplaneta americana]
MTQHGIVHSAEQYMTDVEMPKEVAQNQKFQQSSKVQNEKKPEKQKKKKKNTQPQRDSQKQNEQQRKIDDGKQEKESYYQSLLKEFVTLARSDRYIVVRKSSECKVSLEYVDTSEKTKNTSGGRAKLSDKQPYSDEAKTQNKTDSTNNSSVKTQATDISSAERVNPEVNSKTKTVEKTIEKQTDLKPCEQTGINKTENKRKEKVNKKIRKKQEPEDFDSLIAEFQEMDKRCPWNACKVPTELVGLSCVHCKKRFCITHGLPELHGCGEAARRAARQDFRHPPPPKPNAFKRNAISKKLEKKLAQMAEERKPQKKET